MFALDTFELSKDRETALTSGTNDCLMWIKQTCSIWHAIESFTIFRSPQEIEDALAEVVPSRIRMTVGAFLGRRR